MLFCRIVIKNQNVDEILNHLNVRLKSEYDFYDLIYVNKLGKSITDDTLKIRVYNHNEWDTKDVLVIRKTAVLIDGAKEDKVLLKEEFDDVESAKKFVAENFSYEFEYAFRLSKTGKEYISDEFTIWVEDIQNFGLSLEIGATNQEVLNNVMNQFEVSERLEKSIPEIMYEEIIKDNQF